MPMSLSRKDAPPADGARFWMVPYARNPNFTGREGVLELLGRALGGAEAPERVQVLNGVGGVGKTQAALEFAHRHRESYDLVWWIPAQDQTAVAMGLGKLARRIGGAPPPDASADEIRRTLEARLAPFKRWLLIFDNAPGPEDIRPYLPGVGERGAIILTSRNANWRGTAQPFNLRVFERPDAVAFLKKRTGIAAGPDGSAGRLAQALGDLPLALEQAGAVIQQTDISFADYLHRFEDHWAELLRSGRTSGEYPDTVAMTWELAFREMESNEPMAAALMNVLAFLAPIEVTLTFLRQAAGALPPPLGTALETSAGLDGIVDALRRYALVEANEKAIAMHRLVAALTRDRLPEDHQRNWCEVALRMVQGTITFDEGAADTWSADAASLPHALAVAGHAEERGVLPGLNAKLLNEAGQFLYQLGQFRPAREVFERALALTLHAHGESDPRRSAVENNLARVLNRLGEHRRAKAHLESALSIDSARYGEAHPHVAELANNYGISLQIAGEVEDAMRQFEWALSVVESHYGADHPKVVSVVNNLGYSLANLGDLDKALDHFGRALGMAEASYGESHPAVANIRTNLGIVMRLQGNVSEARSQFERALAIGEATLGPSHPDVARNLTHLGLLLQEQGELETAKRHLERALAVEERVLGPKHFALITNLNYLGRCLKRLGEIDRSIECYARSAAILRHLRENPEASAGLPAGVVGALG